MGVGLPAYGQSGGEVQAWLDRFYMSRIGIRFLIGQREYSFMCFVRLVDSGQDVALNTQEPHKDYVGIICTQAVSSRRPVIFLSHGCFLMRTFHLTEYTRYPAGSHRECPVRL